MSPRQLNLPDTVAVSHAQDDGRRFAPSAGRNIDPILTVLTEAAPSAGRALEIASGTGQHIAAFAQALPGVQWQPTDLAPQNMASIDAYRAASDLDNLAAPLLMDATQPGWAATHGPLDLVVTVNLLHLISETEAQAIVCEVAKALTPGGLWMLYGPFKRAEGFASAGDAAFDDRLRAQDPDIGYKSLPWILQALQDAGFDRTKVVDMPASNLTLLCRRENI